MDKKHLFLESISRGISREVDRIQMNELAAASITKIAAITANERGNPSDAKRAVADLTGKNVRPGSLKKNTVYMMRERNTAHHFNYSQDTFPVIFLGVATEEFDTAMKKTKYDWQGAEKNKKLKDLGTNEYYYFKAVNADLNGKVKGVYLFGAYEYNGSLSIGSGASGVSLYDVDANAIKQWNVG